MKTTTGLQNLLNRTPLHPDMAIFRNLVQSDFLKPILPAAFFLAGVTYDSLTLTRIDRLLDNLILLVYLSVLGALVILTGRFQLGLIPPPRLSTNWNLLSLAHHARPHVDKALQFLLGGLFSAYAILYSQSASLSTASVFLGLIVACLIGNEFLRNRYSSLKLIVTLFALVTLSFLTFFLPVFSGWMNHWMFLAGVAISVTVVWKVVRLILQGIPDLTWKAPVYLSLPAFTAIGFCAMLYFLNWIPPIPLSLKFGGFYHHIEKISDEYHLTFEDGPWYASWKRSDDVIGDDHPVFAFSSVFAPISLKTTIIHHWQWKSRNPSASYVTTDRIPIMIAGGRESGYRLYTMKRQLAPGDWRVDVETEDGRIIGRMDLRVDERMNPAQTLKTIIR